MRLPEMGFEAGLRAAGLLRHDDSLGGWGVEVRHGDRTEAIRMPVVDGEFPFCDVEDAEMVANRASFETSTASNHRQWRDDVALKGPE